MENAIEAVCDKRHQRLCCLMSESDAARAIVRYLEALERKHTANPHLISFINSLKSAYSQKL